MVDEQVWADMRDRLMRLPVKTLKKLAKDEEITLDYAAARKDTLVGEIVAQRRARVLQVRENAKAGKGTPWRIYRSVSDMPY